MGGCLISEQATLWVSFNIFILILLGLDLGVFHKRSHVIGIRESIIWSIIWVLMAFAFNVLIYWWRGPEVAMEFAAGYLIERSLSVDNLFVFMVIFAYFQVPARHQYRVLFWGILVALVLRALFIVTGISLMERFDWLVYVFGAFLIFTGLKLALQKDGHADPGNNLVIRLCQRLIPTSSTYHESSFCARLGGRWMVTPLFVVLIAVEVTDLMFALDSIPAVLAITLDPFIVYSSNVFAILGLRALYFALAGCMAMFQYLNYGITAILVFIGTKMLLSEIYPIPVGYALGVVGLVLIVSVLVSIVYCPQKTAQEVAADER
ncbi:MAG: TerC family protein [Methanotrichaceae archaeon]|nr:TerC family protein [Methanotrichaceae archaeon]